MDLREHYYQNHRAFFSLFALIFLVITSLNPIFFGLPWLSIPEGITALLFSLLAWAAISANHRYHTALPFVVTGVTAAFILLFALRLE